ncbi:MAG: Uma2 family endonuclease [Dysgonamonadaceae bacterium]|jgi:Uma2 family endonuclease|nr:Uma2 family endonuclease [Dysgonamonadaceae bacterium]
MELILDMNRRYTYADYMTWWDDKRRELIDGFINMMSPAATISHARISGKIYYSMCNYINRRKGKCEVFTAPFDVRLPKNGEKEDDKIYTVVQPDICLICDPAKLDERGCIGAPDMIVEVLSPSTRKYDLNDKFRLYEASGVKEYWVVEPKSDISVFLLQEDGVYAEGIVYAGKVKVPVHNLPGLEIDTEELFG